MRKYAAAAMVDRKYALNTKDGRTEVCVRGRNAQDCDGLAKFYSAMYADAVTPEFVSESSCPSNS